MQAGEHASGAVNIPLVDIKAQFHRIGGDVRRAVDQVWTHGRFLMGPETAELETRLAERAGVRHCVTCSSGTDALLMALMAHEIGAGDAVFTTPFTFISSAEVVALLGATPVFVDIDPRTFNMDPEKFAAAVDLVKRENRLRARGVIAVDLFGLPAEHGAIGAIAGGHGLFTLADAAQSFGATWHGKSAAAQAHAAATSFYPTKPLAAAGDGGAVFTDDAGFAEKLRSIRVHGQGADKYDNIRPGLTARLDTVQAAVLLCKLRVFDEELARREEIARRYTEQLNAKTAGAVQAPLVPPHCRSAWAQYSVLCDNRDAVRRSLDAAGIGNAVYYKTCLHQMRVFAALGYAAGDFPLAEDCARRILSLPMHPYLQPQQVDRVVDAVAQAVTETTSGRIG